MSFIRVTQRNDAKTKTDLNTVHVVCYTPEENGTGSDIELSTGDVLLVNESTRQLRSFVRKAQGTLPAPAVAAEATGE
ncbi:hypothetical protein D3C85_379720 [compost metagenome]